MLKNVKSKYIIKIIFLFLDERKKLKLIKQNKSLQKSIDIKINNYMHFTGKYIIYESKGKGKEYNNNDNKLIFEGEYLNGERNGKGKEYDYDLDYKEAIIFEGEYLNGKRNGKGKEYDRFGQIKFEGEYLNGKELIGIRYDENGKILDKVNHTKGKGKEYNYDNKLIFEGEYLNGKRNGKGKEENEYGIKFEGEYFNDMKWNGKIYRRFDNLLYVYELKDGKGLIKEYYGK